MRVKNSLEEIIKLYAAIEEVGYAENFGEDIIDELCICIDEIFSNIIKYAYEDDDEHDIDANFDYDKNERKLTITIVDDGKEFNPLELELPDLSLDILGREIGGLGVFVVSNIMNKIEYVRQDKKNHLEMVKNIDRLER